MLHIHFAVLMLFVVTARARAGCGELTVELPESSNISEDYEYFPGMGAYKLHTKAVIWNGARHVCEDEGGHLAIVNSQAEADALRQLLANNYEPIIGSADTSHVGIGFHDLYEEGDYVTIHGDSLVEAGYANWNDGEPNNAGGIENCGAIHRNGRLTYDIPCKQHSGFICELSDVQLAALHNSLYRRFYDK